MRDLIYQRYKNSLLFIKATSKSRLSYREKVMFFKEQDTAFDTLLVPHLSAWKRRTGTR